MLPDDVPPPENVIFWELSRNHGGCPADYLPMWQQHRMSHFCCKGPSGSGKKRSLHALSIGVRYVEKGPS